MPNGVGVGLARNRRSPKRPSEPRPSGAHPEEGGVWRRRRNDRLCGEAQRFLKRRDIRTFAKSHRKTGCRAGELRREPDSLRYAHGLCAAECSMNQCRYSRCCFKAAHNLKLSDDCVTLADRLLQLLSVHNLQGAVFITDHSGLLLDSCSDGHAGASGSQHARKKLVSKRQNGRAYSVLTHQQPARQTLLDLMKAVADGDL